MLPVEQDILRLEVTVDKILFMQLIQSLADVLGYSAGRALVHD